MKRIGLVIMCSLAAISLFASEVSFTASAPDAVANGQSFQLVYTVNATAKDLKVPAFTGFDVIAGPFTSQSRSVQFVNGKSSSETTIRYTYTLLSTKEGTFNIPSASIVVDKERYQSNALVIKVLPADKANQTTQKNQGQQSSAPISQQITNENLFIRPVISRTKVREQEHVLLTYKIYSKVDLIDIQQVKFPDFKGFLVQEVELPQNKQYALENYDGVNYNTIILRQYLLYPQSAGTLDIEKMTCNAVIRVKNQAQVRSIFDDFFDSYQEVKKPLSASALKISVSALPTPRPETFGGGVGSFSVKSSINATELNANEAVTITVKISGNGNMKMVKNPVLKFPTDFETYEPKVTNAFTNTTAGVSGTKTIEYLAIPRHSGDFSIPETEFSYFDVSSDSYQTLTIPAYQLKVKKGYENDNGALVSNFTNQEQVRMIASDIRYINTTNFDVSSVEEPIIVGWKFWLAYLLPLFFSGLALVFFRKQARENADLALMRNKKANKVARKRLKTAQKHLKAGSKNLFYDEVLKALWGYLCDKLGLPLADLNKENVTVQLSAHAVEQSDIDTFIRLLDDCEFVRYAPAADDREAMDHIFKQTMKMISKLEETIKR